jgi:hypothetical protein
MFLREEGSAGASPYRPRVRPSKKPKNLMLKVDMGGAARYNRSSLATNEGEPPTVLPGWRRLQWLAELPSALAMIKI